MDTARTAFGAVAASLFAAAIGVGSAGADDDRHGEALKERTAVPAAADIDPSASIAALLDKPQATDWAGSHAAKVDGYVIQVEREPDGDAHVALAATPNEPDSRKWLIVEVTPAWQKRDSRLSLAHLRKLYGERVTVTGWLYYDNRPEDPDPRGTAWEVHPVTSIAPSKT